MSESDMSDDTADKPRWRLQDLPVEVLELLKMGAQMAEELRRLDQAADRAIRLFEAQNARIAELELQVRRLSRPKIPTAEALDTFEELQRSDPSLTLRDFASKHELSYEALRRARIRRNKKRNMSQSTKP